MEPSLRRFGLLVLVAACGLAAGGCQDKTFVYTDDGLKYTSEPSGATLLVDVVRFSDDLGEKGSGSRMYLVTPVKQDDTVLVRSATVGGRQMQYKYIFTILKEGYEPIVEMYSGQTVPTKWHWVLTPARTPSPAPAGTTPRTVPPAPPGPPVANPPGRPVSPPTPPAPLPPARP